MYAEVKDCWSASLVQSFVCAQIAAFGVRQRSWRQLPSLPNVSYIFHVCQTLAFVAHLFTRRSKCDPRSSSFISRSASEVASQNCWHHRLRSIKITHIVMLAQVRNYIKFHFQPCFATRSAHVTEMLSRVRFCDLSGYGSTVYHVSVSLLVNTVKCTLNNRNNESDNLVLHLIYVRRSKNKWQTLPVRPRFLAWDRATVQKRTLVSLECLWLQRTCTTFADQANYHMQELELRYPDGRCVLPQWMAAWVYLRQFSGQILI